MLSSYFNWCNKWGLDNIKLLSSSLHLETLLSLPYYIIHLRSLSILFLLSYSMDFSQKDYYPLLFNNLLFFWLYIEIKFYSKLLGDKKLLHLSSLIVVCISYGISFTMSFSSIIMFFDIGDISLWDG